MGNTLVAYLHPNDVGANFAQSLTDLLLYDKGRHIHGSFHANCGAGNIPETRNRVAQFVVDGRYDVDPNTGGLLPPRDDWEPVEWLLMIDSDMGFAPDALEQMIAVADPVNRPIISGLCFMQRDRVLDGMQGYRWQAKPTIFDYIRNADGKMRYTFRHYYPVNQLTRCDATGAAFLLIHRDVFVKVQERFGPAWFDRLDDGTETGKLMGEDISFFDRCRALGIPLWVHTGVKTNHLKSTWIAEPDFWQQFTPPPATDLVDVIVPVLHRPKNVKPFMETLVASTGLATAWFVCDSGDREEMAEVRKYGGRVIQRNGTFAEKVNYAVARGGLKAPWAFLTGDDVQFHPGWLDHAQFFGHTYGASVVGTNDLGNAAVLAGEHATHMLIRRWYIDEVGASWDGPGLVCHEGYRHWFVDNEIVVAAKLRETFQMAMGALVEHMHPYWNKGVADDVYELGAASREQDAETFQRRYREHVLGEVAA